jgi:hypothetical protein
LFSHQKQKYLLPNKNTPQPSEYVEPDVNGYWVKSALWEKEGMTIDRWIEKIKNMLTPQGETST